MFPKEQKLIDLLKDKLPIKVFPERALLPKLRETFSGIEIKLDTILEVHSMINLGDMGGIGCEIVPLNYDRAKAKSAMICSITQLRIKVGEPHFMELEEYRTKRIKKLAKQNSPLSMFNIKRR